MNTAPHPAKFSANVMTRIAAVLQEGEVTRILDPFAGTGRVHWLSVYAETVGVEIEPEWAAYEPNTLVGNALALPFRDATFDCLVSSPCYGNRMADHHEARDSSKRNTYRHQIGRPLHPTNSGAMQWGPDYRTFHAAAWRESARVLTTNALVILNLSNHVRKGVEQLVAEWHLGWWLDHGYKLVATAPIETPRQRHGANRLQRVDHEWLFVLQNPEGEYGHDIQAAPTAGDAQPGGEQLADRAGLARNMDAGEGGDST